ncbi:hypothetical protein [Segetibacter koreensis]|uniref:hypothetical protein n=1 Tax=Segetibacter koreensis TaxID=398037 RepID=UPI00036D0B00|nr:hypothetical protein [Segetibacter koreensis]
MRKISTRIGVYAILLIAALYGSFSMLNLQGKTTPQVSIVACKAATATETNGRISTSGFVGAEHDNLATRYSIGLQANSPAVSGAKGNFFTYSATIQHYISTI